MSDLIERLRFVDGEKDGTRWHRNPDGPEAADRIEALERELDHVKEALAATDYARLKATYRTANAHQEPRTRAAVSQTRAE